MVDSPTPHKTTPALQMQPEHANMPESTGIRIRSRHRLSMLRCFVPDAQEGKGVCLRATRPSAEIAVCGTLHKGAAP